MEVTQKFRNTIYNIRFTVNGHVLVLHVSEPFTGEAWSGEFTAKAVEELTKKTGNYKTFDLFCRFGYAA